MDRKELPKDDNTFKTYPEGSVYSLKPQPDMTIVELAQILDIKIIGDLYYNKLDKVLQRHFKKEE